MIAKKITASQLVTLGESHRLVSKFISEFGMECKINERNAKRILDMYGRRDAVDFFVQHSLSDPAVMHRLAEYLGVRYEPSRPNDGVKTQICDILCSKCMDDRLPLAFVEIAEWSETFEDCR
jgi:hypothetical protein